MLKVLKKSLKKFHFLSTYLGVICKKQENVLLKKSAFLWKVKKVNFKKKCKK